MLLRGLGKFLAVLVATRPSTPPQATTSGTSPAQATAASSRGQLRVTVLSAVLHPAATPAGIRRKRARLSVRARVRNPGAEPVVPPRPSLLAARQRTPTDARAETPVTSLGTIDAGKTVEVTLRFETAGAVTEQLTWQKRARILVAGRSSPVTVSVGTPVTSGARSGATAP